MLVDANGVPLVLRAAGANESDQSEILPAVFEFPRVRGTSGRPKENPDELYGDRGYDSDWTRLILMWMGITPKIAKRRTEHGSGLGRVRWVVERTIGWLKGFKRMRVRWDRLPDVVYAWNKLAISIICVRLLCECSA